MKLYHKTYTICRKPLRHLKKDHEVIPVLRSLLTDNPPFPGKVGLTTGVYIPYSFRTDLGFFYVPQEPAK